MGDLVSWLLSFFLIVALFAAVLYQVMCLADLENDYVNPYDSASEINIIVIPEFVLQGALCFLHLVMGHWLMCLVCLPYLYYDVKVYTDHRHLLDVTEIFNQLPWEKKIRLYKLGYLGILLGFSIIWFYELMKVRYFGPLYVGAGFVLVFSVMMPFFAENDAADWMA